MDPERKPIKKLVSKHFNLENIFIGLIVLLGVILLVNTILTFNLSKNLKKSSEAIQQKLNPAKIELTLIKNSKCNDCFDISTIVSHIKNAYVNITKETMHEFNSKEGKEIINKYRIKRIPTVVITGEIDNVNIQGLEKKENALILTRLEPPYTNALSGEIEGKVTLYYLTDSSCSICNDLKPLVNQIKSAGVKILDERLVVTSSDEGQDLIRKYKIDFVPTIILSKDASVYPIIKQEWPQVGSIEDDGSYVLRLVYPPFVYLTTNKLRGIVNITYLTDRSCSECYDVNLHRQILVNPQGFAIRLIKEERFDISEDKGKELIAKYNITQVPTIILSDEINAYPSKQALRQFFSIEEDGFYVFRRTEAVGTYKDLITNQVVKAQQQTEVEEQ